MSRRPSWRARERRGLVPQLDLVFPWAPSLYEVLRWPWAEDVDLYDRVNRTNVRAELEAAGIPIIPFQGSATQRQRHATPHAPEPGQTNPGPAQTQPLRTTGRRPDGTHPR